MSLFVADNVMKIFGANQVLVNVSFRLDKASRVGLVGPNGGGKTTLLRIVAGELKPTEGSLQRSDSLKVGYLPQEPPALAGTTLHESMLEVFADIRQLEADIHGLADKLADKSARARYDRLHAAFEAGGGYDYTSRIETVLTGLGFANDQWDMPLAHLSGGQRTRAYLGRMLLSQPDLLLLDEPTNHLDLASLEWLERWLESYRGALVLVSHDRYFLDRVTNNTWEVAFASLAKYRGSYSKYLGKRDAKYQERLRLWQSQQEYITKTEDFIQRYIAGQRSKESRGRQKRLERFLKTEAIPKPRRHGEISVKFRPIQRSGDLVVRAESLSVGYEPDKPLLAADDLEVRRSQRVAVIGPTGVGKTTLIKTFLGGLAPLSGKVRHGSNTTLGYLSQTHEDLDPSATALAALQSATGLRMKEARDLLGSLLLSGDEVLKKISELSGGQRSRVILAKLVAQNANVLFLDEPTNHLDIPSQEILQQVLRAFAGTIVFVSHDRYLIDALATHVWAIDGTGVKAMAGKWDAYLKWRSGRATDRAAGSATSAQATSRREAYRLRRRQQNRLQRLRRRLEEVERLIHDLESELQKLQDDISAAGQAGDVERVTRLGERYDATDRRIEELNREWEGLGHELEAAEQSTRKGE